MNNLLIFGAKYLFIFSLLIILYYFLKAESEIKKKILIFGSISLPIIFAMGKLASFFYYNPRPFVAENFTPLIEHTNDNGFPSDHVLLLASLASLMTVFNLKWAILLWTITFLVAISRVYVGVHHPIDVLASIIISGIVTGVIYFLSKKRSNAA